MIRLLVREESTGAGVVPESSEDKGHTAHGFADMLSWYCNQDPIFLTSLLCLG